MGVVYGNVLIIMDFPVQSSAMGVLKETTCVPEFGAQMTVEMTYPTADPV